MRIKIWILLGILLLILLWFLGYLTNPLRHSIDIEKFYSIMGNMPSDCRVLSNFSVQFDSARFPIYERPHIIWKHMLNNSRRVAFGRQFFSDWYSIGTDQEVLHFTISGIGTRLCLVTIETPEEDITRNKKCLKIIQQQLKNVALFRR